MIGSDAEPSHLTFHYTITTIFHHLAPTAILLQQKNNLLENIFHRKWNCNHLSIRFHPLSSQEFEPL